jgi:4-amino-4-deoxy-L-arabinose transferase-like glycosyltransferase
VRWIILVFLVAGIARILTVIVSPNDYVMSSAPILDPSEYLALAHNLKVQHTLSFGEPHRWGQNGDINATGPFIPGAPRAPLYPAFIALLWWGSGIPTRCVIAAQIILGATTAGLAFLTALRPFGKRTAIIAGLMCALAPLTCFITASIMSETLFTFLLTLGVYLWGQNRLTLAGVAFGFGALARAVLFPFVVVLALIAVSSRSRRIEYGRIALSALLVIAPWTVRNLIVTGTFVPIASQGWGSNLYFATIDVPYGSGNPWSIYGSDKTLRAIVRGSPTESEAESAMVRTSLERIRANPLVTCPQFPFT